MSANLPMRIARPLHRQCLFQHTATRSFSTTFALQKKSARQGQQRGDPVMARANYETQKNKAPSTLRAEQYLEGAETMDDIGLLPGTFVRSFRAGPSPFPKGDTTIQQALKDTLSYNWKWLRSLLVNQYGLWHFRLWLKKGPMKLKPKTQHSVARKKAVEYYEKLYTAFAQKDEKALSKFCLSGLMSNFANRIASRPSNMRMTWSLLSISRPWIVSSRAMPLPGPGTDSRLAPSALQQIIFKMKTRQRLVIEREDPSFAPARMSKGALPWSPDGAQEVEPAEDVQPDVHEKDVVEYLVLQRKMNRGTEEAWKVWGFADPTTLETLKADDEWIEQTNAWEAHHRTMY